MNKPDWIKQIEERHQKATPGTGKVELYPSGTVCVALEKGRMLSQYAETPNAIHVSGASPGDLPEAEYQAQRIHDARFVSKAHSDVEALLSALNIAIDVLKMYADEEVEGYELAEQALTTINQEGK